MSEEVFGGNDFFFLMYGSVWDSAGRSSGNWEDEEYILLVFSVQS